MNSANHPKILDQCGPAPVKAVCTHISPELGNSTGVPVLCTKTRTKVQGVHTHKLNGPKLVCVILFWTGTIRANPMHGCTFASHSESILYLCILTANLSKKVTACTSALWSTWVPSKVVPFDQDFKENHKIFVVIFKKSDFTCSYGVLNLGIRD